MRIDIWSDLVCPFCYLGKHRLEAALADWPQRDEVEIVWHAFELDRNAPAHAEDSLAEHIAAKYGTTTEQAEAQHVGLAGQFADLGLSFDWRHARRGNTFDAHRVVQFAQSHGNADAVVERLMRGYFSEGEAIGDRATLVRLAADAGLDADAVAAMLDSEEMGYEVRIDEATAGQLGINGVPFFVFDQRLGLSGAQPPAVFTQALTQAWETRTESPEYAEGGCGGGCCGGVCGSDASAADAEVATPEPVS